MSKNIKKYLSLLNINSINQLEENDIDYWHQKKYFEIKKSGQDIDKITNKLIELNNAKDYLDEVEISTLKRVFKIEEENQYSSSETFDKKELETEIKDEKPNTIENDFKKLSKSHINEDNENFKYKEDYGYESKKNREPPKNRSKPVVINNRKTSKFEDPDEVHIEKEKNKKKGQNIYNYNYVNTNKNDKSPISGWFILIFFIVSSLIVGVLIANGYFFEAVGVVFVSGVLVDIFALFWRPTRKAIGLVNIILGILLMLSIVGFPFGILLLLFGAILMFI